MKPQDQSQRQSAKPYGHSEEQIRESQMNIERCLRALDQRGEEGLQEELDRIYPGTSGLRTSEVTTPSGIRLHGTKAPIPLRGSIHT
jgi:hypothetical protein